MLSHLLRRFAVFAALASCVSAHAVTFLTEENRPFNYTGDGKVVGMSVEIVREAAKRAGLPAEITVLPWEQVYERGQIGKDTCVFSLSRLPNRERLFSWVGQLGINKWSVFAKNDFAKPVKAIADLRPFKIGGVTADSKVEFLRANAVTNIKDVARDEMNPPRLFLNATDPDYIDLWITGHYAAAAVAEKAKVGAIKLVYVVREEPLWLACSPRTDRETVKRLVAALDSMQKDGSQQRIASTYENKLGAAQR